MQIVPAILTADLSEARKLLEQISQSARFNRVQFDFIDGEYANNLTIKPEDVDLTPFLRMEFDAHLMVVEKNIDEYVKQSERVGFDRIIAQAESVSDLEKYSGLALDIHSPLETLEKFLPKLEVVVLMAIEPGFGGQEFNEEVIDRAKYLVDLRDKNGWKYKVQIDGGVQREHLDVLEKAGVDEVVVGAGRVLEWK